MARTQKTQLVYLDTHIIIWLYDAMTELFSDKVLSLLEKNLLFYSPIVELELTFLSEIKRLNTKADKIIAELSRTLDLRRSEIPFHEVIYYANQQSWTRDPFDRIIVGETLAAGGVLITKDRDILSKCSQAIF